MQPTDVFVRRDPAQLGDLPWQLFLDEVSLRVGTPALLKRKSSLKPRDVARVPRIASMAHHDRSNPARVSWVWLAEARRLATRLAM